MTNIFFLSLGSINAIKHCKISGKFDNNGKGKIRFAIRLLMEIAEEYSGNPDLYIFIKNDKKTLNLGDLDCEYNKEFSVSRFRSSAGTGTRFRDESERNDYIQFKIDKTFENPTIIGKNMIFPKNIECTIIKNDRIPDELKDHVGKEDILIKITFEKDKTSSERLYIFQLAIILENFLPREEVEGWKVPSKVWSANFNIHETIGYETLVQEIKEYMRYPDIIELWVYLPSGHQLVASSPLYKKAMKIEARDFYRTSKSDEFVTKEGDLAVKLMNELGKPEKFSIICSSPHMIEEKIEKLVEGYFEKEKKNFVTWGEFIQPLALLVGLFSLVISIIVVLAVRSIPSSECYNTACQESSYPIPLSPGVSVNLETIMAAAILFGMSAWAVSTTLRTLERRFSFMSLAAPSFMTLLGIAGWLSIKYQEAGFLKDLTPWFSIASILTGGILFFTKLKGSIASILTGGILFFTKLKRKSRD